MRPFTPNRHERASTLDSIQPVHVRCPRPSVQCWNTERDCGSSVFLVRVWFENLFKSVLRRPTTTVNCFPIGLVVLAEKGPASAQLLLRTYTYT